MHGIEQISCLSLTFSFRFHGQSNNELAVIVYPMIGERALMGENDIPRKG